TFGSAGDGSYYPRGSSILRVGPGAAEPVAPTLWANSACGPLAHYLPEWQPVCHGVSQPATACGQVTGQSLTRQAASPKGWPGGQPTTRIFLTGPDEIIGLR